MTAPHTGGQRTAETRSVDGEKNRLKRSLDGLNLMQWGHDRVVANPRR